MSTPATATPDTPAATWLPCLACGLAVRGPFEPEAIEVITSYGHQQLETQMTRCETCLIIRTCAEDLMRAHPGEALRIGDRSIAVHRLEIALNALDALGVCDAKRIDALTDTGTDVRRLIDHLAVPGGVARFATSYVASIARGERMDRMPSERWATVTDEQRQALRDAAAALFQSRVEKPVPVPCPDGGCMLCGVAAVDVLPSQARGVWIEMSADPITLGGRDSPEMIDGAVCPRCDYAINRAEGVGVTAMGLSVLDYLGGKPMNAFVAARAIDGIVGWGVLSGAKPNSEPWGHVDLSALPNEART